MTLFGIFGGASLVSFLATLYFKEDGTFGWWRSKKSFCAFFFAFFVLIAFDCMCKFMSFTLNDVLLLTEEGTDMKIVEDSQSKWIVNWASWCNSFYAVAMFMSIICKYLHSYLYLVVENQENQMENQVVQPQVETPLYNFFIIIGFFVYFTGCDGVVTFIGQVLVQTYGRITERVLGTDPIEGALGKGIVVGGTTFVIAIGLIEWMGLQQVDDMILKKKHNAGWMDRLIQYGKKALRFQLTEYLPLYPILAISVLTFTAGWARFVMIGLVVFCWVNKLLKWANSEKFYVLSATSFRMLMVCVYGPSAFWFVSLKWSEALGWLEIENETEKADTINKGFSDVGMVSGMISPLFFLIQSLIVLLADGDGSLSFAFNLAAKFGTAFGRVSSPYVAIALENEVVVIYYRIAAGGLVVLAVFGFFRLREIANAAAKNQAAQNQPALVQ
jgi:hypothetical protein